MSVYNNSLPGSNTRMIAHYNVIIAESVELIHNIERNEDITNEMFSNNENGK